MSRGGKLISRENLVYPKVFSRDIDKLTKAQSLWNCPEGFTIFCMVEPIQQLTLQKGCPMICGKNAITRTGILPCPALQITACNATPVLVSNPSCPQALSKQNGTWSGEIFSPLHTNMPPHIQYTLEKRCYGSGQTWPMKDCEFFEGFIRHFWMCLMENTPGHPLWPFLKGIIMITVIFLICFNGFRNFPPIFQTNSHR